MSDFVTSDLHLYHDLILKYRGNVSHTKHLEIIRTNWNSVVSKRDCVYILGDLTLKGQEYRDKIKNYLDTLHGRKILILGNHDDRFNPFQYVDMGFESVHTSLFYKDNILMIHDPSIASFYKDMTILCGHVHELFTTCENAINVGLDVRFMYPVLIDSLICEKNIEYYMSLQYEEEIIKYVDQDGKATYFINIPLLGSSSVNGDGDTIDEARESMNNVKRFLFQKYLNTGVSIPEPD